MNILVHVSRKMSVATFVHNSKTRRALGKATTSEKRINLNLLALAEM